MPNIPGTKINAVFQHVADGSHPHLFYGAQDSGPAIASMNAGNSVELYVGGGGINGAFPGILQPQCAACYQNLHVALADNVAPGASHVQDFDYHDPARTIAICNNRVDGATDYTGVAFVDVFADHYCPNGNTANSAMLYVAPPNGGQYSDAGDFKAAITQVGANAVEAAVTFNTWAAQEGRAQVQALRLCMYSSGIYRMNGVSLDDVALVIFAGIEFGLQADSTGINEVQMPVGQHERYFAAVQEKLQSA